MSVYLLRPYMGYTASSTVPRTFDSDTETALITQGFALAVSAGAASISSLTNGPDALATQAGNIDRVSQQGYSTPTYPQGPLRLMAGGMALGSAALTGYETNGVAQTAGTYNMVDIFVPYVNTWTGVAVLQGTTVGTNFLRAAVWGTSGALLASSPAAGVVTAGASTFLLLPFTYPTELVRGRYIIGIQADGNTDTIRHMLSANGSMPSTTTLAGTFGTDVSTLTTVPTTFTTAQAPICYLYT